MTYRDLRSVMFNRTPSKFFFVPDTLHPPQISRKNSSQVPRKNSATTLSLQNSRRSATNRKKQKCQGVDVYRSLSRADSRCSTLSEREAPKDEMMVLANSFLIEHTSSLPIHGYFHPQNLPNIQKHRNIYNSGRIGSSRTKFSYSSSPSLRIQHVGYKRPVTPQLIHRTTPTDLQYEEDNNETATATTTTTTTTITATEITTSSPIPEPQPRRQLHVYLPQVISY